MKIGFVGIGHMGLPMAMNLLRSGVQLHVWNRTADKCAPLIDAGAVPALSIDALCEQVSVLLLMLRGEQAIDEVLGRRTPAFRNRVAGKCIVHLGTTAPAWSHALGLDVIADGGRYVEAPVSGSRIPAEKGALVGMVAGERASVEMALPLLAPLCSRVFHCGDSPHALRMKLAVNHYLIASVTALAETVHAARAAGLDLNTLREVLDAGPMASDVSRVKLEKLVNAEFSAQASIADVADIARLVTDQIAAAGVQAPLMSSSEALFHSINTNAHRDLDMAAVILAYRPDRD